jgi:ATP-binding protein involved in chromosome partitioning
MGTGMGHSPNPASSAPTQALPGVDRIVAIGSGKGGVGKTTVSVNVAVALAELGYVVGLLDADVYGPNVPMMMGRDEMPRVQGQNLIQPLRQFGVRFMSMGLLNPGDKPVIWRGPMLHSAVQQFLRQVEWGQLDTLIIDLPPGTGDISLSLAQSVPLTGGIVVTTPSAVSLQDARKALNMFQQLRIPVLGVVENMSTFVCPHCHHDIDIFSQGGGERTAEKFGVPFLGALPLLAEVRRGGDSGRPAAAEGQDAPAARPFFELAKRIAAAASAQDSAGDILHVRA